MNEIQIKEGIMRLQVRFHLPKPLCLPINYQQILQGYLYHMIEDEKFSDFLHNHGYQYGKRQFRLFVFGRLQGKPVVDMRQKSITFTDHVEWQISSCLPQFIRELGQSFLMRKTMDLNGQPLNVEEIKYEDVKINQTSCIVRMLSPITVCSTYVSKDGKKTTQYFAPNDPAFCHLVQENMLKKYAAYFGEQFNGTFQIKPLQYSSKDKVITRFKGTLIEGWHGRYLLEGDPEILSFAYAVGLGARNSQGFGMPLIERREVN
jgi:CRISPR-associated endoribonuclease Cas6